MNYTEQMITNISCYVVCVNPVRCEMRLRNETPSLHYPRHQSSVPSSNEHIQPENHLPPSSRDILQVVEAPASEQT